MGSSGMGRRSSQMKITQMAAVTVMATTIAVTGRMARLTSRTPPRKTGVVIR